MTHRLPNGILVFYIVTIHRAGRIYGQMRHGKRPRLGLGLEFAHSRACASLLTLAVYHASFVYTHGQQSLGHMMLNVFLTCYYLRSLFTINVLCSLREVVIEVRAVD